MKALTELSTDTLEWRRGGASLADWELHAQEGLVATLSFRDNAQELAQLQTAEGTWTLKHAGLMGTVVTLREEGEPTNLAIFHPHPLRHGHLVFADGARFDWVSLPATPAGTRSGGAFLDSGGVPLVQVRARPAKETYAEQGPEQGPEQGEVQLGQHPAARWRHAQLAGIGWYLLVTALLRERQSVAAETSLQL